MSGASGKGSSPAGYTTTTQGPPSYMLPYVGTGLSQAGSLLSGNGPQYYPGQQVAGFSDPQQEAMGGITNLGLGGTPALSGAENFDTTLTNSGGGSNPWLDAMFTHAAGTTQNQLASEFASGGRNLEASEPLRGEQLNNLATSIYGNAYQDNIQNALEAGSQAQGLYGTAMGGLNAAEGVGQRVQNLAQQQINANQNKYNYYQQLPYQQLGTYEQEVGALQPGGQSSNPYFTNQLGSILGYTMLGNQLFGGGGSGSGGTGGAGKGKGQSSQGAGSSAGVGSTPGFGHV